MVSAKRRGLDELDVALISALQANGRTSLVELGRRVGLRHSSVRERLRRAVERGYIRVQANVSLRSLGLGVAFLGFEVAGYKSAMRLIEKLRECPRTLLVGFTSGEFNVVALMIVEDMDALRIFIERNLRPLADIRRISINFGEIVHPEFVPAPPLSRVLGLAGSSCMSCELFEGGGRSEAAARG